MSAVTWIECTEELVAIEQRDGRDHFTSHAVFAHKVLGEPWLEAMKLGAAFRHRALTFSDCLGLLADWYEEKWGRFIPDTEGEERS